MTRAERATEKVRKEKEKRAEEQRRAKEKDIGQRKAIAHAEAAVREETRKAVNKRRYRWGAMADEAGLFVWSDADAAAVFAVLKRLRAVEDPAVLLDGLVDVDFSVASGVPMGFPEGNP